MVTHENYEAYTVGEIIEALWGKAVSWPTGVNWENLTQAQIETIKAAAGTDFSKAWPGSMSKAALDVYNAQKALADALPNLQDSNKYLTGPNGVWKGPAAGAFDRITRGITQWLSDTLSATNNEKTRWQLTLSWSEGEYTQTQIDAWNAYVNNAFVVVPGDQVLKYYKNYTNKLGNYEVPRGTPGSYGQWTGTPPRTRFDEEKASAAMRPFLSGPDGLVGKWNSHQNAFFTSKPPAGPSYEPAPPPEDPQKKIDEINDKANKQIDDIQTKAAADLDKAQSKFDKDLEKAQQPPSGVPGGEPPSGVPGGEPPSGVPGGEPPSGVPGGEPPSGLPGGEPLPGSGGEPLPGSGGEPLPGLPGGVPVDGGVDVNGDGKADLPAFTLPGDSIPAGREIPPPIPPPDGTVFPLDENGKVVPGGAILPGAGGLLPPDGLPPPGGPGARAIPQFVRPSGAVNSAAGSSPFVRTPGGGLGGVDEFGNLRPPKAGGVPGEEAPFGRVGAAGKAVPGGPVSGGVLPAGLAAGAYPPGMGGMMPPMGGMGGMGMGGQPHGGDRDRQTWLLEDDEVWSDSAEVAPNVLGRVTDDEEEEEYAPRY
jgi:hypothetical protein